MEEGILPSGFCGLSELQTSGRETALIAFVETGIAAPTGMHGASAFTNASRSAMADKHNDRLCWIPHLFFHPHLDPPPSAGGGRIRNWDYFMPE